MKVSVLSIIPFLLERILFISVTPWLLKTSRTSDLSHSWKLRQRIIPLLVFSERWGVTVIACLLMAKVLSAWLFDLTSIRTFLLRSFFCLHDVSYCTFKQFLNTKDRKFDGLIISRCHNQKAWTNLFFVRLSFFIEGIHGDSEHTHRRVQHRDVDVRGVGWAQGLEDSERHLPRMSNVRFVRCHRLQKINQLLNFRAWHDSRLIRQDHIWPPVLGEIQAKVMCCSEASADTSSLNHQDPFIHPYGSQFMANELPVKWSWCPDSRLLRQVGLTVEQDSCRYW